FTFTKSKGDEPFEPGLMSFTITVPPLLPSLFHNSLPLVASYAVKYKVLFKTLREEGPDPFMPLRISFTSTVPVSVPSLFHNSFPLVASHARKNKVPFTFTK